MKREQAVCVVSPDEAKHHNTLVGNVHLQLQETHPHKRLEWSLDSVAWLRSEDLHCTKLIHKDWER